MQAWYTECQHLLPEVGKALVDCSVAEVWHIGQAYALLRERQACTRKRDGFPEAVRFGPTGASKVLFAVRPQAAIPWDAPERKALRFDDSDRGYIAYLRQAQGILRALSPACRRYGIQLADLPTLLGRREATPAKLVDEYYWATVTRGGHSRRGQATHLVRQPGAEASAGQKLGCLPRRNTTYIMCTSSGLPGRDSDAARVHTTC